MVKAEIYYPFVDVCAKEVVEYCTNISDYNLPNCMLENEEFLSEDCLESFMEYDRDRWAAWDSNAYNAWFDASHEERALYRKLNWEEMKQRESGGEHANFPRNPVARKNSFQELMNRNR